MALVLWSISTLGLVSRLSTQMGVCRPPDDRKRTHVEGLLNS
jgi:hypothetical protein